MASDEYEMSDPYTIGGATGAYAVPSPYHTECEWTIISAVALGSFTVSTGSTPGAPTEVNVPASVGPTTLFSGAGILQSILVTATGAANLTFQDSSGNIIAEVLSTATVGQPILVNEAFNVSLVANNSATTPVVTVTYAPMAPPENYAIFAMGAKNPSQPNLSRFGVSSVNSFGSIATSSPDSNNALPSFVGALTQSSPFVPYVGVDFMPLPSPSFVYLQTSTPANTIVLVTVQFRRKLDRVIPEKPRGKPSTHSHVKGRRDHRTMMEGFASQYPEEGIAYHHVGPPSPRPTPPPQLQPTNNSHRGVSRYRG
jgi:hypothetical protein